MRQDSKEIDVVSWKKKIILFGGNSSGDGDGDGGGGNGIG